MKALHPRRGGVSSAVIALAMLSVTAAAGPAGVAPVLERVQDVPLPGAPSRLDYQSLDTTAHRLYVSHMGEGELVVFDLANRKVVGTVDDLPRITGVRAVPALGKVYASVPGHHQVAVIDARSLRIVATVGRPRFPDGIAWVPEVNKIYVSDEAGGGELVIDGVTNRLVQTIPLEGEAGNTIYDPATGQVLVAVQNRNEIAVIDPHADRVIARHALAGASGPHGMAIDGAGRWLFVADENNATLQMIDLRTWAVVGHERVGEEPDVLAFDPVWHRLYVGSESGVVSAFTERHGKLESNGRVIIPHAHSVCVDPRTHRVYLPLQNVGGRPVLRIMAARHP